MMPPSLSQHHRLQKLQRLQQQQQQQLHPQTSMVRRAPPTTTRGDREAPQQISLSEAQLQLLQAKKQQQKRVVFGQDESRGAVRGMPQTTTTTTTTQPLNHPAPKAEVAVSESLSSTPLVGSDKFEPPTAAAVSSSRNSSNPPPTRPSSWSSLSYDAAVGKRTLKKVLAAQQLRLHRPQSQSQSQSSQSAPKQPKQPKPSAMVTTKTTQVVVEAAAAAVTATTTITTSGKTTTSPADMSSNPQAHRGMMPPRESLQSKSHKEEEAVQAVVVKEMVTNNNNNNVDDDDDDAVPLLSLNNTKSPSFSFRDRLRRKSRTVSGSTPPDAAAAAAAASPRRGGGQPSTQTLSSPTAAFAPDTSSVTSSSSRTTHHHHSQQQQQVWDYDAEARDRMKFRWRQRSTPPRQGSAAAAASVSPPPSSSSSSTPKSSSLDSHRSTQKLPVEEESIESRSNPIPKGASSTTAKSKNPLQQIMCINNNEDTEKASVSVNTLSFDKSPLPRPPPPPPPSEEYTRFVQQLQAEVSGLHTQLWSSFQAAFDPSLSPAVAVAPHTTIPTTNASTPPVSPPPPPRKKKLDASSTRLLKALHQALVADLQTNHHCTTMPNPPPPSYHAGTSQLVNDKTYYAMQKQKQQQIQMQQQQQPLHVLSSLSSGRSDSEQEENHTGIIIVRRNNNKDEHKRIPWTNTATTIHTADTRVSTAPLMDHTHRQQPTTTTTTPMDERLHHESAAQNDRFIPTMNKVGTTYTGQHRGLASNSSRLQLRKGSKDSDQDDNHNHGVCQTTVTSSLSAPQQQQQQGDFHATVQYATPFSSESGGPASMLKKHLSAESTTFLPPRTNLTESTSTLLTQSLQSTPTVTNTTNPVPTHKSREGEALATALVRGQLERTSLDRHQAQEVVYEPVLDSEAVLFRLASLPNFSLNRDETAFIMLEKTDVMIVSKKVLERHDDEEANNSSSSRGTRTLWKIPRSELQSLSIDMSTLQVNLCCVDPSQCSQSVLFETNDDCLLFANTFYGRPSTVPSINSATTLDATKSDRETESIISNCAPKPRIPRDVSIVAATMSSDHSIISGGDGDSSSIKYESLNDEEQTLLETYRELRRKKGAHAALLETLPTVEDRNLVSSEQSSLLINESHDALNRTAESHVAVLRPPHRIANDESSVPVPPVSLIPSSLLTAEEEEVAKSFRTMLKLNFPLEVIRHRMTKEQVSQKIVDNVLGKCGVETNESARENVNNVKRVVDDSSSKAANEVILTPSEEILTGTYRKMLKMGFEKAAVRHRMKKELVDERIINIVLGPDPEEYSAKATESIVEKADFDDRTVLPKSGRSNHTILTAEEESLAIGYRKMLKIQVPKEMVLSRMRQDGMNEKIIASVGGIQASISKNTTVSSKDNATNTAKLVPLHWTPLSGNELDNSVWRVNSLLEDVDSHPERNDVTDLVALFQKKTSQGVQKEKIPGSQNSSHGKANLIDVTRLNNISISLKAFKEFSFKDLTDSIAYLDPLRMIPGEKVQFLRDLLPTPTELDTIRAFKGPDDRLAPAELWFRHLVDIQRLEIKVKVLKAMETFLPEVESLLNSFRLLGQVCQQVMDSDKLVLLLGKVLRIGNIMNQGTRSGGASGFKFDSLLRLTQTRSSDNKITVLDFLVKSLVDRGQRNSLDLLSDFPECQSASRIVVGDLITATKDVKVVLSKCEEELVLLKQNGVKPKTKSKNGSNTGSTISSNSAMLAQLLSRSNVHTGPRESPEPKPLVQRENFLAAIKERAQDGVPSAAVKGLGGPHAPIVGDNLTGTDEVPIVRNDLPSAIRRLEDFLHEAKKMFAELEVIRSKALQACSGLARYCGESGGTGASSTLLGILATFANNLNEALKRYDAKKDEEARKKRKLGDDVSIFGSESVSSRRTNDSNVDSVQNGTSLVFMVSDMLKDANDRTKDDFIKGRVYTNPSSTLKAIYDCEQSLNNKNLDPQRGSQRALRRTSIVTAIEEQESSTDQEELRHAHLRFCSNDCTTLMSNSSTKNGNFSSASSECNPSPSSLNETSQQSVIQKSIPEASNGLIDHKASTPSPVSGMSLSEARKARSLLEKMVNRSPLQPIGKSRHSLGSFTPATASDEARGVGRENNNVRRRSTPTKPKRALLVWQPEAA